MANIADVLNKHKDRIDKIKKQEGRKKIKRGASRPWQEQLVKEKTQKRHDSDTIPTQKRHKEDTIETQRPEIERPSPKKNGHNSDTIETQKKHSSDTKISPRPIDPALEKKKTSDTIKTRKRHNSDTGSSAAKGKAPATTEDTIVTQRGHDKDTNKPGNVTKEVKDTKETQRRHNSDTNKGTELNIKGILQEAIPRYPEIDPDFMNQISEEIDRQKVEETIYSLRGLKLKLFKFICNQCLESGKNILSRITYDSLSNLTGIPLSSMKTTAKRLRNQNLICIRSKTRGKGAFVDIIVNTHVKNLYMKSLAHESKVDNNNPEKTAPTIETPPEDLVNAPLAQKVSAIDISAIDFSSLVKYGFHEGKLKQLIQRGKFSDLSKLQASLDHLSFYLSSDDSKGIKEPLSWIMKQLNAGYFPRPYGFKTSEELALEKFLQDNKKTQEKLDRLRQKAWEQADQNFYREQVRPQLEKEYGNTAELFIEKKAKELFFQKQF